MGLRIFANTFSAFKNKEQHLRSHTTAFKQLLTLEVREWIHFYHTLARFSYWLQIKLQLLKKYINTIPPPLKVWYCNRIKMHILSSSLSSSSSLSADLTILMRILQTYVVRFHNTAAVRRRLVRQHPANAFLDRHMDIQSASLRLKGESILPVWKLPSVSTFCYFCCNSRKLQWSTRNCMHILGLNFTVGSSCVHVRFCETLCTCPTQDNSPGYTPPPHIFARTLSKINFRRKFPLNAS